MRRWWPLNEDVIDVKIVQDMWLPKTGDEVPVPNVDVLDLHMTWWWDQHVVPWTELHSI